MKTSLRRIVDFASLSHIAFTTLLVSPAALPFLCTCTRPHCCAWRQKSLENGNYGCGQFFRSTSLLLRFRRRQSTIGSTEEAKTWSKSRCVVLHGIPSHFRALFCFIFYRKTRKSGFRFSTRSRPLVPPPVPLQLFLSQNLSAFYASLAYSIIRSIDCLPKFTRKATPVLPLCDRCGTWWTRGSRGGESVECQRAKTWRTPSPACLRKAVRVSTSYRNGHCNHTQDCLFVWYARPSL